MKKVVIGLSGGVDSCVAAYLLKNQGFEVYGVTLKVFEHDKFNDEILDAKNVAKTLGIFYKVIDCIEFFENKIINYFCDSYIEGKTPNPCVMCNRTVKFSALLNYAKEINADYIATGHYANKTKLDNGRFALKKIATNKKDQTYALSMLTQDELEKVIFPLADLTKDEVRKIAKENNLPVAKKSDSQDICFVPDHDYAKFIENKKDVKIDEGNFVDIKGNILGKHKGIIHYTVGQRKGLGIAFGKPCYVREIKSDTNEIIIGELNDIMQDKVIVKKLSYMGSTNFEKEGKCLIKIRYNHKGDFGIIRNIDQDTVEVIFDKPQKGIAPGQTAVFYKDDYVLGGGIIQ